MNSEALNNNIISFFESVQKYYGCKTEVTQGILTELEDLNPDLTTWNLSEFDLIRSAYRKTGNKFMFEGKKSYYEIDGGRLIDFKETGRNKFEFVEFFSDSVYRVTKIRFHYKY